MARRHGFIDPVSLLGRLQRFAEPSEVAFPLELVRAGALFHARGLMNTKAIQHNLDWLWPYWVERQFDPGDEAFIPRAFSVTHINLTHRNWTGVGVPGSEQYVVVDPAGLIMPFWDGWSLDSWIIGEREELLPSRLKNFFPVASNPTQSGEDSAMFREEMFTDGISQELLFDDQLAVRTAARKGGLSLTSRVVVKEEGEELVCLYQIEATADTPSWLVVSLRPYNGEGVSFVHQVQRLSNSVRSNTVRSNTDGWRIDGGGGEGAKEVHFDQPIERSLFSHYRSGDVFHGVKEVSAHVHHSEAPSEATSEIQCEVGLATAAAMFRINGTRTIEARVPLGVFSPKRQGALFCRREAPWRGVEQSFLSVPEKRFEVLWRASIASLVLHAPGDIFPGPFTYKRFWFRDAAFIGEALLSLGYFSEVERVLDRYPERQRSNGYFLSQEGEWDSNGAALWSLWRWCLHTNQAPKSEWKQAIVRGANWVGKKRVRESGALHNGLLPAGFSAEHLGTNDYYYWDDFWCAAGLLGASELATKYGAAAESRSFSAEAQDLLGSVEKSLDGKKALPASPYRRLDSGAIGSIAASYPLQLLPPSDPRLMETAEFLLSECCVHGGFFQDMIHSGINAYLTLHLAQVLLRAGDSRFLPLVRAVADLASPTGQWPEAIHPRTLGGCMGDGHHAWASAEWVLMMKNLFVREEGESLILCSGILPEWLERGEPLSLKNISTRFGRISVEVFPAPGSLPSVTSAAEVSASASVHLSGAFHTPPHRVEVRLPGYLPASIKMGEMVELKRG